MNSKLRSGLLAAATGAMMMMMAAGAQAQAPGGGAGPGAGGPPRGGMAMGPVDRASTIERNGLADPALKLTAAQKAEIDRIADAYVAEVQKAPAGQEAMTARMQARQNMTAAVNKVLTDEQRKTWETAQAGRRPPGGMGGPGAGAGAGGRGGPGAGGPGAGGMGPGGAGAGGAGGGAPGAAGPGGARPQGGAGN